MNQYVKPEVIHFSNNALICSSIKMNADITAPKDSVQTFKFFFLFFLAYIKQNWRNHKYFPQQDVSPSYLDGYKWLLIFFWWAHSSNIKQNMFYVKYCLPNGRSYFHPPHKGKIKLHFLYFICKQKMHKI